MKKYFTLLFALILLNCSSYANPPLHKIKLPKGFKISLYAYPIPGARQLSFAPDGTLFVGSKSNYVYAVSNTKSRKIYKIAQNLKMPVGVSFYKNDLYISDISKILVLKNIKNHLNNPPKPLIIRDDFPKERWHGWKFIAFDPDGFLYVPVGAPCNVCLRKNPVYSSITRMKADGSNFEIFAHGIRNTVGFDWHPKTKELWFTENGRDNMGDNIPPDELNKAPKKGLHFGFPFIHGKNIKDPRFFKKASSHLLKTFIPPVLNLPAHVAALGMRFYKAKTFPKRYHHQIFVAEHGSWNRSKPIGYRISFIRLSKTGKPSYEVFASGWLLKNGQNWGRPVDIAIGPKGNLYVSDDKAGAVYKISYNK